MPEIKQLNSSRCFGGYMRKFSHFSSSVNTEMIFSVFFPFLDKPAPVLYFLSGLTCTDENFSTKSGAQRAAAKFGVALIVPDTSPRGAGVEGETESWDFGVGAGFYVNATEPKWSKHYNMYSYVTEELPALLKEHFSNLLITEKSAVFGHSMGGHGALIVSLKNPGKYKSVSAFAPISNPINCPWGQKAFSGYLGADQEKWKQYDASVLAQSYSGPKLDILIDQGLEDKFYIQKQLLPEEFQKTAGSNSNISLNLRFLEGYDHSFYFISTVIDEHIEFHANHLK
eukprot:TRINITY_DN4017_c0_g1_i1.p1 TRINITY_DN4017_c0_g1~~TRINITY_DN4017_c0_g1_i1.p1  ORF type:complete len:295 (-),score=53.01 TRINITY_DN4017_c0_g1_i1:88-939(-)